MNSSLSSMKNGVQVNSCTFLGLGVPLNSQRFSNYFADCSVNVKLSAPCRQIPSLAKIKNGDNATKSNVEFYILLLMQARISFIDKIIVFVWSQYDGANIKQ